MTIIIRKSLLVLLLLGMLTAARAQENQLTQADDAVAPKANSINHENIVRSFLQARQVARAPVVAGKIANTLALPIKITPSASSICVGSIVPLTASPPLGNQSSSKSISAISDFNRSIADASPGGLSSVFKITGMQPGVVIRDIEIWLWVKHERVGDLVINLKGPNGKVLNIANRDGGAGENFGGGIVSYSVITSSATKNISFGNAPFMAEDYAPAAALGIAGATVVPSNVSNVTTFEELYGTSVNGDWTLSLRDDSSGIAGKLGLAFLIINYDEFTAPTPVVWSPVTNLFLDAHATTPYSGQVVNTVYARPSSAGTITYKATTSGSAPVQSKTVTIDVTAASDAGTFPGGPLISACYGSGGTVSVTGSVGTLQWQTSPDGINWAAAGGGNYSDIQSPVYYRVGAQNTSTCKQVVSAPVKVGIKNMWTGNASTNWTNAANWSNGVLPNFDCEYIVIPNVATGNFPILVSGIVTVKSLVVKPGAALTIQEAARLRVGGTLTSDGGLDLSAGTIELRGTSAQSISSAMFKDTTIANLVISNNAGVTVATSPSDKSLAVTNKISFNAPNAKLNSGDNITLKSSYAGTASLGELNPGNSVSGRFTVERYINSGVEEGKHGKRWLFLATPAAGQTIRESWMENGNTPAGYGISLTSPDGTGWDKYSPAPAIKEFDANTNLWKRAGNATDPLYNEKGWMVFVRGDRSRTEVDDPANATTLRSKGTLITGNKLFTIPADPTRELFFSVGNPYASAVDLRKVINPAEDPNVYVWNPYTSGDYGLGAYRILTYLDNDFIAADNDATNNFLLSGQAFFLQRITTDRALLFKESAKGDTAASVTYFREAAPAANVALFRGGTPAARQTSMLKSRIFSNNTLLDGTLHIFGDYSGLVDAQDGRKMINTGVNLSLKVQGKLLAVERKQPLIDKDTIFFDLTGTTAGKYRFAFGAQNMAAPGLQAWLEDGFTKERISVNLEGDTEISFDVTAAAASRASDRFRMVFAGRGILPVSFIQLNAIKDGTLVDVQWQVAQELNVKNYIVMTSTDGINFTDIGNVPATAQGDYFVKGMSASAGNNYYRIRSVDADGNSSYSSIVKVFIGENPRALSVFPNPVINGYIHLRMENYPAGRYQIRLLNPGGQVLTSRVLNHTGGNRTEKIAWDNKLAHGNYHLELKHPDGSIEVIAIVY